MRIDKYPKNILILLSITISLLWLSGCREGRGLAFMPTITPEAFLSFNEDRAMQDIQYQLSLGARTAGSAAHQQTGDWIVNELTKYGWQVDEQKTTYQGQKVRNITGKYGSGQPLILVGAHYDSRMVADHDPIPANQMTPVPGANDGASGVAVLLEMARVLPNMMGDSLNARQVWLVFLDAEDNGRLPGWDWILGSKAYVQELSEKPDAVVIIDMIGDQDLNIYQEKNSDLSLTQEIWDQAHELGYGDIFIKESKHKILDDHIPFLNAGIKAIDIIDFDYPYYHTTNDTIDKIAGASLKAVGETLLYWITNKEKNAQ